MPTLKILLVTAHFKCPNLKCTTASQYLVSRQSKYAGCLKNYNRCSVSAPSAKWFCNNNFFDKNLMITLRNWVHYQHNKNLKFSISPFAYFWHYESIQYYADELAAPDNETRLSTAVEMQTRVFNKWCLINRSAAKYRIFNNQPTPFNHIQYRSAIRCNISTQTKCYRI